MPMLQCYACLCSLVWVCMCGYVCAMPSLLECLVCLYVRLCVCVCLCLCMCAEICTSYCTIHYTLHTPHRNASSTPALVAAARHQNEHNIALLASYTRNNLIFLPHRHSYQAARPRSSLQQGTQLTVTSHCGHCIVSPSWHRAQAQATYSTCTAPSRCVVSCW